MLDRFWQAELSSVSCRAGLKPDLALLEGLEPGQAKAVQRNQPCWGQARGSRAGFSFA